MMPLALDLSDGQPTAAPARKSLFLIVNALQDRAVTAAHGGIPVEVHFRIDNLVKA